MGNRFMLQFLLKILLNHKLNKEVENIIESEKEKGATLASALGADNKKVAAITAAVDIYIQNTKTWMITVKNGVSLQDGSCPTLPAS